MPIDLKPFEKSSPVARAAAPSGLKILIAVAVIGIGLLHVVGYAMLRGPGASEESIRSNNYGD
jgi:hypothetical protein